MYVHLTNTWLNVLLVQNSDTETGLREYDVQLYQQLQTDRETDRFRTLVRKHMLNQDKRKNPINLLKQIYLNNT